MATFVPISYTYVPTAPRSKSATARRKPALKPVSIFDKIQRIKPSGAALSTPRPAAAATAADDNGGDKLGIRKTSTGYYNNENDDDCDLPPIEQLLYTTLQKEGFAAEDKSPNSTACGVKDVTVEERGSNGSVAGDNSGGGLGDPIVLLGDDDSSASEAEVDGGGLYAESAAADESLLDNLETAVGSTTPAPPSNPDVWHDIDNFLETAQRLRRSEQKPSTSDSMRPHTPSSSRASSEPLHDHTSAAGQCTVCARSEATMCSSARRYQLSLCARASPENQPVHKDHLHAGRSSADEHELEVLGSILDTDPVNEGKSQRQEVNDPTAVVTTKSVDDTHPSNEDGSPRPALLPSCDPLPMSSHDDAGSCSDGDSDNDLNDNKADLEDDDEEPCPMKRKRPSSSHDGPMQKKRKCHPKQSAEGRLPSPAPSALQTMDTEMPSDCSNLGGSSSDILPTLTEVTFRPHSQHYCSFTAVVRDSCDGGVSFSQLTRLIESIGYVGKIDDFTIKPFQQHSFLLTGFSRHTSSRPLFGRATVVTAAEVSRIHRDTTRTRPQDGRAVDAGALPSEGSEPSSSYDDDGLSDSDPDLSSGDDGCSSKEKQGSSTRMNIPWEAVDEQRLLAYKKEDKSWDWIFKKFPGRTPAAVRTRWTMVQHRVK
ncbi:hypothetical protein FGG08_007156 [Glutinoglossum americanum]|uniref:Myb-like domain-containing protein n=1 Tax=Glutinoglossum americanum TaxID=1670608 RepID=A0A9P8HZG0_9PEZI|nr:hypothetical protein FGG08_007156 [Glutinoglossum americanum]